MKPPAAQLYSVNALSKLTGSDRKTIDKVIAANGIQGVGGKYALADIRQALDGKADKSLRDQKLAEEIRKLQIKNDKDQGKLIAKTEVVASIMRMAPRIRATMEQKLLNEYPSVVAGLGEPDKVRTYSRRLYNEVMAEWASFEKEWPA